MLWAFGHWPYLRTNLTFWALSTHAFAIGLPLAHRHATSWVRALHGFSFVLSFVVAVLATLLVSVYNPHIVRQRTEDKTGERAGCARGSTQRNERNA